MARLSLSISRSHRLTSLRLALTVAGVIMPCVAGAQGTGASTIRPFTVDDALNVVTYAPGDLSRDGRWLATTSSTRRDALGTDYRRDGDPTYVRAAGAMVWVIETATGTARPVFADKRTIRGLTWSPDGARLAMLLYTGDVFEPAIWDRASAKLTMIKVPAGRYVAETSDLRWTDDGRTLVFALHSYAWRAEAKATFARMTVGPVFVQSSEDPFLAWDALRRMATRRSVVAYDLDRRAVRELLPEGMVAAYTLVRGDSLIAYQEDITKKTDYDVIFGTENRLMARAPGDAAGRVLMPTLKGVNLVWAEDGTRYAYGRDGRVFVTGVRDTTTRQLAGLPMPARGTPARDTAADTSATAREQRARERFTVSRFSPTGDAVLLANRQGFWVADVASGQKDMILETGDSTSRGPRYTFSAWSEDGRYVYFARAARDRWERGFVRYDRTAKRVDDLMKDGRIYSGLRLARQGNVALLSVADGNRPADLYLADASLGNLRRLTDANPWIRDRTLGGTELVDYLDADGHHKYGVVYLPAGYQKGTRYPTVFEIYEDFFDDTFNATVNVLTGAGYAVVHPSVDFDVGYPGEAWVKGVTAAANALIERGIADSARLGVHGTSYGGYATNLLITQTNRFKAAINISGKVDIISFYTDSPRLGVRNIHAAEKSQDRLGATLWQQPQKYVAHSAIMFADRITTPLLLMTGAQDSNVPADNTREMYYALRRLGKTVTWVDYMNSGHGTPGTTAEDFTDFHRRMLGWYEKYLKATTKKKDVADGAGR